MIVVTNQNYLFEGQKLSDIKIPMLSSFFSTEVNYFSLSQIKEKGDEQKAKTEYIRSLLAIANDENQSQEARNKAKDEASKLKRQLPIFFPSVYLEDGKKRENIKCFFPLYGFDIDHKSKSWVAQAIAILRQDQHIAFTQPSCSGSGIHGVVYVDTTDFLNEHWDGSHTDAFHFVWNKVREYVEDLLGEKIDGACKNPERGLALCYDELTFFNPDATPLHIDTSEYQKPKVGRPRKINNSEKGYTGKYHAQLQEVEEFISKSLDKNGKNVENGRNTYLYAFAMECNKFGVQEQEVRDWATMHLMADDFDQKEIESTIASAYSHTDIHGTTTINLNDIDFITKTLNDMADFRYNETLGRMELKYKGDFMDRTDTTNESNSPTLLDDIMQKCRNTQEKKIEDWHVISDRDFCTLYTSVRSKRKVYQNEVNAVLSSLTFCQEYNPLLDYISKCPTWDPSQRDEIGFLFNHLQLKCTERKERLAYYLRMWFLRFVAKALGLIDLNDLVPCIVGEHNSGKTFYTKMILPPELRDLYYQLVQPNEPLDKDMLITLSTKYIVDLDEFNISRDISSTMKAIISSGKKSVRKPYGRYAEMIRSVASLMLTCNDSVYIGEAEGDRRYITLEIVGTVNFDEVPINYPRLYAQALYLIANGELRESLTSEEVHELSSFNEDHVEENPCMNAILTFFRKPQPGDTNVKWMTNYQIRSRFSNSTEYNETNVGRALSKLGYNDPRFKKKVNGIWKYAVVELPLETEPGVFESDGNPEESSTEEGHWYDDL